ncbi:hypothetical protein FQA39_LY10015 [Lamprigera yunnana]|nr:hypothetical protein FQA39_LY10015 [Lamprigera yunnana]
MSTSNKPYTEREKVLLASLVNKFSHIVENKSTDGTTWNRKKDWQKIATYYNAQPETSAQTTDKQLKKFWDNLKQNVLLTGGGPPNKIPKSDVMDMVDFVVPNLDAELVPWDSNNIGIQSINEIHMVETNDEPNSSTINNDHNYIQEIQDITSPSTSLGTDIE